MWVYRQQSPLVFTHIPRAGGTSLREAVKESLEPDVVYTGFDGSVLGAFSDVDSLHRGVRRRVALTPQELPPDATFVSGHIAPSTTRARFPEADHFTVLREPRVRLISQWLFSRAHSDFNLRHWGGLAAWMRAARAPLVEYLNNPLVAPHVDNVIVRLLLWPHDLTPSDRFIDSIHDDELFGQALEMLDSFPYVGIIENQNFVAELGEWLGRPLSLPRLNEASRLRQPDTADVFTEVSGSGADALGWRTRIDMRLWEHLAGRVFSTTETERVRDQTYRDAVRRYSHMVTQPARLSYPRRIAERSYRLIVRD